MTSPTRTALISRTESEIAISPVASGNLPSRSCIPSRKACCSGIRPSERYDLRAPCWNSPPETIIGSAPATEGMDRTRSASSGVNPSSLVTMMSAPRTWFPTSPASCAFRRSPARNDKVTNATPMTTAMRIASVRFHVARICVRTLPTIIALPACEYAQARCPWSATRPHQQSGHPPGR